MPIGFYGDHETKVMPETQLVTPEKSWLGSKDDGDPTIKGKVFHKDKMFILLHFFRIFFLFSFMYVSMIEITTASYILVFFPQGGLIQTVKIRFITKNQILMLHISNDSLS